MFQASVDPQALVPPRPPQAVPVSVEDSQAISSYANFCRVTGTAEEMILEFGLSPQAQGPPLAMVPISQRIIVSYYTLKRLLHALQLTIEHHEQVFGTVETDATRRAQPVAFHGD